VFNIFRNSKNISEELILNHGYKLALEFGKDWLQPEMRDSGMKEISKSIK
jgi:hypothetical protein